MPSSPDAPRRAAAAPTGIEFALEAFYRSRQQKRISFYRLRNLKQYLGDLQAYLARAGVTDLMETTPALIRDWIIYLSTDRVRFPTTHAIAGGLKPSTVNSHISAARTFFGWCEREGYTVSNPARGLEKQREDELLIQPLTRDEVRRILEQPDLQSFTGFRDYVMMQLLYDTGIRVSELCHLRLGDVDWETRLLRILGKGRKQRRVPFGLEVTRLLRQYLAWRTDDLPHDRVFVTNDAKPFASDGKNRNGPTRMLQIVRDYGAACDPPVHVTPHTFRHTFAIEYLRAIRGDALRLQAILGHSTLEMVKRYVRCVEQDLILGHERASPADRLQGCTRRGSAGTAQGRTKNRSRSM